MTLRRICGFTNAYCPERMARFSGGQLISKISNPISSPPPSERLPPLSLEHAAREDFQPPWVQPNGCERVRSRAIPSGNDCRVITHRLGPIEKKVPHHDPRLVIESPCRPAFCDTGVMRWRP